MIKYTFFLTLFALFSFSSCKNTPATAQAATAQTTAPVNNDNPSKSSAPDPNDLLKTLQGRWQSEQDPTYTLEISDTQMRHLNGGQLTSQSMIDVDGACESAVCKPEGVDTSDGWCFTEITIESGKYAAHCNFVILCDPTRLQYRALSSAGSGISFKKIQ